MAQSIAAAQEAGDSLVDMTPTPSQTPPKTFTPFPTSIPSQSSAQSGHSYVNETQQSRPKEKPKTKGAQTSEPTPTERPDTEELPLDLKEFPDFLPPFFDLPKKMLKVGQPKHLAEKPPLISASRCSSGFWPSILMPWILSQRKTRNEDMSGGETSSVFVSPIAFISTIIPDLL